MVIDLVSCCRTMGFGQCVPIPYEAVLMKTSGVKRARTCRPRSRICAKIRSVAMVRATRRSGDVVALREDLQNKKVESDHGGNPSHSRGPRIKCRRRPQSGA